MSAILPQVRAWTNICFTNMGVNQLYGRESTIYGRESTIYGRESTIWT